MSLYSEIKAELDEFSRLTEEGNQLQQEIQKLSAKFGILVIQRGDFESLTDLAEQGVRMAHLLMDDKAIREEIADKVEEAKGLQIQHQTVALNEILQMAKRAKEWEALAVEELKQISARLSELIDDATPEA
jgi:hypothetical protein